MGWHIPAPLSGVIIGNKDFSIFTAVLVALGQVIDAADRLDAKVLIQFPDEFAIIVADQPFPLAAGQGIPQPDVIFFLEFHSIMTFRLVIGRITIDEGVLPLRC